jgi:hypothetical protein
MASKKTTTDDVMTLVRGAVKQTFSYEEWTCVRVMWIATGQRLGPIHVLFGMGDEGEIEDEGVVTLRGIVEGTAAHVLARPLSSTLEHGPAAGAELFQLVKKQWKLPYHHATDSTDGVRVAGKRLPPDEVARVTVPTLGELPPFRRAHDKLRTLVDVEAGGLTFKANGPRTMAERSSR